MGKKQDALFAFRIVSSDNILLLECCSVVGSKCHFLLMYLCTEAFQFAGQIVPALFMGGSIGHTGTEINLPLHELIGAVGVKYGRVC